MSYQFKINPPPQTKYNFLSLGAGVQSSTLALMAAHGEVGPMPDAAIFADTQAEPKSVYVWLDWLEKQLPYPVYKVSKGSLQDEALLLRQRVKGEGKPWAKSLVPAYTIGVDGSHGIMPRPCTADYKVAPIIKKQRQLAQIKRGQKEITVTSWIGISWDEIQRMKMSREIWMQHRWPLIELKMTRQDCKIWMRNNGYPEPPRSSCVFCPYHSDAEWRRLRDQEPEAFERAVNFDHQLRKIKAQTAMRSVPYLHPSCLPLDDVDLSTDIDRGQMVMDFNSECEGMCGV